MTEITPAPTDFDTPMADLWAECQQQLRDQETWVETDRHTLEEYVRAKFRSHAARGAIGDDMLIPGDRGKGMVANPLVKVARDAELDAQKYADALILTPQLRRRHGVDGRKSQRPGDAGDDTLPTFTPSDGGG